MNDQSSVINVSSKVSSETGEPSVVLSWGNMQGQLSPDEARFHAMRVLACADGSEGDAFIVKFLQEQVEIKDKSVLAGILQLFRAFRSNPKAPLPNPQILGQVMNGEQEDGMTQTKQRETKPPQSNDTDNS